MKPPKQISRALVVYKKSPYEMYLIRQFAFPTARFTGRRIQEMASLHRRHYETLEQVRKVLRGFGVAECMAERERRLNCDSYDLVVTVGGDGTFLAASKYIDRQTVLGVNSNPRHSVGRFCAALGRTFEGLMRSLLEGRAEVRKLNRMSVSLNARPLGLEVLNDVLVCHQNPSAMSHYSLQIGPRCEYQHSSGLWVSTAAGSTGAVKSAGGCVMPLESAKLQYRPRELFQAPGRTCRLKGGCVDGKKGIKIVSDMESGVVFVDGSHTHLPLARAETLRLTNARRPLFVVDDGRKLFGFKRG